MAESQSVELFEEYDKNLYKTTSDQVYSFNPESQTISGDSVLGQTINNSKVNQTSRVYDAIVDAGGKADFTTIEDAVKFVNNELGGGVIFVTAGTYVPLAVMTISTPIQIIGESSSLVTVNFASQSVNFVMTGLNVYTTGTIASIASGVTVTGSGTTWASSMIGQQIFINNRWYVIANVSDTTHLTLATGYADGATYSGNYRISTPISEVTFSHLTLKNSTTTAIVGTDIRDVSLLNLVFLTNNKGYTLTNGMNIIVDTVTTSGSTSNGYELTNCSFVNSYSNASVSNGGSGAVLNNIKACGWILSAADSNTADGFNCTDTVNCLFKVEVSGNGGQGIEFVSGCNTNFINDCLVQNNTSDGVKLTATSDSNTIGASAVITGNGGYGINIAASTCDNNVILSPLFSTNTSGSYNDAGTSTIVIQQGASVIFGGTGADGALSASSGTTTIDLGSAAVVVKNYTSISLTGTANVTFTNPHDNGTSIFFKSQGNVVLTSSANPIIDLTGVGAAGGAAVTTAGTGAGSCGSGGAGASTSGQTGQANANNAGAGIVAGNDGNDSNAWIGKCVKGLGGRADAAGTTTSLGGASPFYSSAVPGYVKNLIVPGAGGGSGASCQSTGTSGAGGRGGGAMLIECKGALNFASTISAAGGAGGAGGANNGKGGGGGGGGSIIILYNSLTANTGTLTVTGGLYGTSYSGADQGGSGGNGISLVAQNINFN
jgi:hypothetical protein